MLVHPTIERLHALGLSAMADAFVELQNTRDAAELSREDWLGLLLDREVTHRENRKLTRRLRAARLRQAAVVEDVDFRAPRGLDRGLFQKLATCHWIRDHQHLAVVGPTGIGKSWIACALGHKACREGFSVLYKRTPRLFADLAQARGEGRLPRLMAALERTRLLILDDSSVEPTRSQNTTVSCRRSASRNAVVTAGGRSAGDLPGSDAIALSSSLRGPSGNPSSLRSASVSSGRTAAVISLSRKAGS